MLIILPFSLLSFKSMNVLINDNVSKHARGSYDLLVRPSNVQLDIEEKLGVVEENYLDGGAGGISIQEWYDIREMANVEVAAPVASLGFFTGESASFSIWMPDQSTRYSLQYYTSDGIQDYPILSDEELIGLMLEQEFKPRYSPPFASYDTDSGYTNFQDGGPPTFLFPPTYHLLAAIDPKSEEKITGISFDQLKKENIEDPNENEYAFAGEAPLIPLLKLSDPDVPLSAQLTLEAIGVTTELTSKWKEEFGIDKFDSIFFYDDLDKWLPIIDELLGMPAINESEYNFDFSKILEPFEYEPIAFSEDLRLVEPLFFSGHQGRTSLFYQAKPLSYTMDHNEELQIKSIGHHNGIPIYRNMEEVGVTSVESENVPFVLYPAGEYTVAERVEELSASPLGIYQLAPNKLFKDAKGKLLPEEKEVAPTIYPGSFVAAPAHGVIDIHDAPIIKGDLPIDAIRVRVSGITEYNDVAQTKIEEVAKEILHMGFSVDVVAGASYQEIPVEVENIGTVLKPWTTLGSAASIIENWSGTTIWMTILFSICVLVYIANRIQFHKESKEVEMSLLHQIGWSHQHIKQLFRFELIIIFFFTWCLSIVGLYAFQWLLEDTSFRDLLKWNLSLAMFTIIFMLFVSETKSVFQRQRKSVTHTNKQTRLHKSSLYLSVQSIKYYKRFLYSAGLQLILVGILSIFILLALNETVQQSNITMLGQYINFNLSSIHMIILGSAYILVTITIIESIFTLMMSRKQEIDLMTSIGWYDRHIIKIFLKEICIWSSVAVFIGHALGLMIYSFNYEVSWITWGYTLISVLAFIGFILLLSTIVIWRSLKSMKSSKDQNLTQSGATDM